MMLNRLFFFYKLQMHESMKYAMHYHIRYQNHNFQSVKSKHPTIPYYPKFDLVGLFPEIVTLYIYFSIFVANQFYESSLNIKKRKFSKKVREYFHDITLKSIRFLRIAPDPWGYIPGSLFLLQRKFCR